MTLRLKSVLEQHGIAQQALAAHCHIGKSTLWRLVHHGEWPARKESELRGQIEAYLRAHGISARDVFKRSLKKKAPTRGNASRPVDPPNEEGIEDMVLRRQKLTEATRRAFGLSRDPFADPSNAAEVFLSKDIRYVRESMMATVKHGGFLAVIGESGAGKSTLRDELIDRIQRELPGVIVIQPYMLASEDSDNRGKPLRSVHIAEAIQKTLRPLTGVQANPESRFAQVHNTLRDSARTGNRHVMLIEEAHSLPIATLKHLKRWIELKDGLKPLLSIILIGQPELAVKLSEQNPEVREVVQRIELVSLAPLDNELEPYLAHRFAQVGVKLESVFEPGAIEAVREVLSTHRARGSLLHPLAVNNLVSGAMNAAVDFLLPKVTAEVVRGG